MRELIEEGGCELLYLPSYPRTTTPSRSANHNAPSDTNYPILGLQGLLGLLALVERLQAAHISQAEEVRRCRPEEHFPRP